MSKKTLGKKSKQIFKIKKKELLVIFLLALIVTTLTSLLSFDKCLRTLTSICHFTHCRGWPLSFYYFYTLNPAFPEECKEVHPPEFIWLFLVVDVFFWFVVLFSGCQIVKFILKKRRLSG